jgi:hypothetical protein
MKERIFIVRCRVVKKVWDEVILDTVVDVPRLCKVWRDAHDVHLWGELLFPYADVQILTVDGKTVTEWHAEEEFAND